MENLFGRKDIFAIEYRRESQKRGFFRLWINGKYLGSIEDAAYFSYVQGGLQNILINTSKLQDFPFAQESADGAMKKFIESKNEIRNFKMDRYIVHLGESFDDFFIFSFVVGDQIHFVWKLVEEPFFNYPNYPVGAQNEIIKIQYFEAIVNEFLAV